MFDFFRKQDIKKVLIFRFGAIGDVVHTTALYRSLKSHNPKLSIHYLTGKVPSELLEYDHALDKIWILENKSYKYLLTLAKELKREKFDICINLQPSIRTKVFSRFIQAKKTLTYKKTFKRHAVDNFWVTARPEFKNLVLDEELKLFIPDEIKEKIFLDTDKPVIGFNMGANSARQGRKWPLKHWKELAEKIINNHDYKIILTGSQEDSELAEELVKISPEITSFCGKLSIAQTAALLSKCSLVISGDTGPLHIATAIGTQVLGLYGSMPPERTGPYGEGHFVLTADNKCIPCNRRKCKYTENKNQDTPCMEGITPDQVLIKINESLK